MNSNDLEEEFNNLMDYKDKLELQVYDLQNKLELKNIEVEQFLLKATCWDIAVKKNVDMFELKYAFSVNEYNVCKMDKSEQLTKEEFETLKKGLK